MKALEVWINGEKKCVAGTNDSVLHAIVSGINVRVSGVMDKEGTSFHAQWLHQNLQVGDEVTIRITEADEVEPPQQEMRFQTQTEGDDEKRTLLIECRDQLPASLQQSDSSTLELFSERLQQDNFPAAMRILGDLGQKCQMKAAYWKSLARTAHRLGRYDESGLYGDRYRELKENGENTS